MSFLNSFWLWTGLAVAGVSVPIIIHLLHQKHRRRTDWAAMELLRRAMVVRSGQVRLEDYLLLFLRCLLVALVAFALMRPTLREWTGKLFGEERIGMVVAVDASYSMTHGKHTKRFRRATDRATQILSTARVGDPATVMLMGKRPRMLLRATGYEEQRFRDVLEETSPLPEQLNLERCLAEAAQLVGELKTSVRECYLVTDAQATDWADLSDEAKAALRQITETASLFLVPVAGGGDENLAVTRFQYASGSLAPAGTARFVAEICNHSRTSQDAGEATLEIDGQAITRQAVGTIAEGETKVISFFTSFDKPGDARLRVKLSPDSLKLDNQRHTVVTVRPRIRVLCVDGEPSSGENPGETFYLVKALRLKQVGEDATIDVVRCDWQDVGAEDFGDYDLSALANVPMIEEDVAQRLFQFVNRGGGLMVFCGDRIDADSYNSQLQHNSTRLLPGELLGAVSAAKNSHGETDRNLPQGWRLGPIHSAHTLAAVARAIPKEQLASARFDRIMKVRPDADATSILSLSDAGLSLLLEKEIGQGTVLLVATTADRHWGNLAVHPLYPMLVQQAVTHLASRPGERDFTVGDSVHVTMEGGQPDSRVTLRTPEDNERSVQLAMLDTGKVVCPIEANMPGIYDVIPGNALPLAVAVNVDPLESDVKTLSPIALAESIGDTGIELINENANLAAIVKEARSGAEISRTILILAVLVFLLQGYLARRFTRRMTDTATDVTEIVHRQTIAAARRT